jgi:hypothetical protein
VAKTVAAQNAARFKMNKGLRHQIKMLHYKKRLRIYRVRDDSKGNYYALRHHSTPCSCMFCSRPDLKYNRAKEKVKFKKQFISLTLLNVFHH